MSKVKKKIPKDHVAMETSPPIVVTTRDHRGKVIDERPLSEILNKFIYHIEAIKEQLLLSTTTYEVLLDKNYKANIKKKK